MIREKMGKGWQRIMNVLLVGDDNKLLDAMINKLNKSSHRIYWLTGQKGKRGSRKRVFETYNFSYTDVNVKDIIDSVRPDVVLFTGAYDTSFDWKYNGQAEVLRYTTAMVNILTAYVMVGGGRFIYLSSQEVFDGSYANDVPEATALTARGFKSSALSQGEGMCGNYKENQGVNTIILRLDHIYGIPEKEQTDGDPCFEMCLEALRTGKIPANSRKKFSMLYLNDAVELIHKVIEKENAEHSCYHISSMEEIDEMQLAEIVRDKMGGEVSIIDRPAGDNQRLVLDGRRYQEEFGQKIFVHYEKGVDSVVRYMKQYSDSFLRVGDDRGKWSGKTWYTVKKVCRMLFPFLESLVCFGIFSLLNQHTAGSQYFDRLDFYLLYVLLFAIVHGQQLAIFSALLSVVGYCIEQAYIHSVYEVLLDYNTYVWMAQLFIVGMTVGYMRDYLRHIQEDHAEETRHLYEKIEGIAEINDSNVRMKQSFEAQLVNQKDSLGKVYEITSQLDQYGPEEVLFYAAQMLGRLMNSRDVSVYLVVNSDYARLYSATSADARRLGSSIRYTAMDAVYDELKEGRVYINKTMADDLPLMASAVFSEGEMQLILMLWGIPWQHMTLAEANRLTIIGTLIQNAMVRAARYLESLRNQRYVEGTNVLNEEAFTGLVSAFLEARHKGLTECALLEIHTAGQNYEQVADVLSGTMRSTDYLGVLKNGKLYALLSNTNEENVAGVIDRFKSAGYESLLKEAEL